MDRLTMRNDTTKKAFLIDVDDDDVQDAIQKLADYEDKQEQGLLIELPCKVGDTVYELLITGVKNHEPVYEIYEAKVIRFIRDSFYWCCETITKDKNEWGFEFVVDSFGKWVFLTRSEAEEALAKMGGKA